jgi:hypothetical protein
VKTCSIEIRLLEHCRALPNKQYASSVKLLEVGPQKIANAFLHRVTVSPSASSTALSLVHLNSNLLQTAQQFNASTAMHGGTSRDERLHRLVLRPVCTEKLLEADTAAVKEK